MPKVLLVAVWHHVQRHAFDSARMRAACHTPRDDARTMPSTASTTRKGGPKGCLDRPEATRGT
eukprot:5912065-Alexandrium_andersonii.AAC.1